MGFSEILGQPRAVTTLRSALASGHLHHAWLFGGPSGVGKELTARVLAQAANCERNGGGLLPGMPPPAPDACGECGQCRKIANRNHPDVLYVVAEAEQVNRGWAGRSDFDGTPSRDIKIGQIRALQDRLALKALEAKRKFAIVVGADGMNVAAQNALLKTLEEPPSDTTLVLVSSFPNALLPTIRSRCLKLAFAPLAQDIVAARVQQEKKTDAATARLCAALSGGSMSLALALDPNKLERRKELITRLESLKPGEALQALHMAAEFGEDREKADVHLELMGTWYRDIAALASGGATEGLVNQDLAELARARAKTLSVPEALRRIEMVGQTRGTLRGNASPRLQFEALLLRFAFPAMGGGR